MNSLGPMTLLLCRAAERGNLDKPAETDINVAYLTSSGVDRADFLRAADILTWAHWEDDTEPTSLRHSKARAFGIALSLVMTEEEGGNGDPAL